MRLFRVFQQPGPFAETEKTVFAALFLPSVSPKTVLAEENRAATWVENASGRDSRTCAILFGNPGSVADGSQRRERWLRSFRSSRMESSPTGERDLPCRS